MHLDGGLKTFEGDFDFDRRYKPPVEFVSKITQFTLSVRPLRDLIPVTLIDKEIRITNAIQKKIVLLL